MPSANRVPDDLKHLLPLKVFVNAQRTQRAASRRYQLHSSIRACLPAPCGERTRPAVPDDATMVESFLKLGDSLLALSRYQICFNTNVNRIEARNVAGEIDLSQLNWDRNLQTLNGYRWILAVQSHLGSNRRQPQRLYLRVKSLAHSLCHGFGTCAIACHRKG